MSSKKYTCKSKAAGSGALAQICALLHDTYIHNDSGLEFDFDQFLVDDLPYCFPLVFFALHPNFDSNAFGFSSVNLCFKCVIFKNTECIYKKGYRSLTKNALFQPVFALFSLKNHNFLWSSRVISPRSQYVIFIITSTCLEQAKKMSLPLWYPLGGEPNFRNGHLGRPFFYISTFALFYKNEIVSNKLSKAYLLLEALFDQVLYY